jgi:hypothetical protein
VATVNKNFRVKNGLVVEGLTATVNGQNILVEGGSDSYIIDLIGGQATSSNTANAVVKRDGSGNFSAGTITATFSGNLTGNVTGTVSSLSNHNTDDLSEGNNLYYTAERAKAEAANLLVNSSQSNIVITKDGSNNLTITAENGVADSTTDDLAEGTTRLYFTTSRAREAISGGTGISYNNTTGVVAVDNTIATKTYADDAADAAESAANGYTDSAISTEVSNRNSAISSAISTEVTNRNNAITDAIDALDTDDIEEGLNNKYFTNSRARNAVSAGTGLDYNSATGEFSVTANTYDPYGAASDAEGNAQSYTDNAILALDTDDIEEGSSNKYFTDERAQDAVGNSVGNGLSYNDTTGAISVDTSVISTKAYVDQEVAALVDGAPGLLDTLNEIAAAINDDANYFTTVANNISQKVAKSGDTMTGSLTLHADPTNALHAATKQYVDQAETDAVTSANSYTDGAILAGNAVAEPVYAAIDFNGIAKNIAASVSVPTAGAVTAYEWNHNGFTSGKFTVKVAAGTHTELSEILVTADTSNNVHLTEYGIVGTNGSLSTISADYASNKIRIRVTTLNNNSTVVVAGTLIGS